MFFLLKNLTVVLVCLHGKKLLKIKNIIIIYLIFAFKICQKENIVYICNV